MSNFPATPLRPQMTPLRPTTCTPLHTRPLSSGSALLARRKTMVASSAPFVTALVHTGALIPATALLVVLECRGRPLTSPMQAFSVQSTVRLSVIRMALFVTAITLPTRKLHVRKLAPSSSLSFLALSAPSVKMSGSTPDPTARISPLMSETVCEPTGLITLRLTAQANGLRSE